MAKATVGGITQKPDPHGHNSLWRIISAKALAFPALLPLPSKCNTFFTMFEVPSPTTKTGWFCHPLSKLVTSLMHATALTALGLVKISPEMHISKKVFNDGSSINSIPPPNSSQ
jgi:hypothetical protein